MMEVNDNDDDSVGADDSIAAVVAVDDDDFPSLLPSCLSFDNMELGFDCE
jgi:hypothetical protein